MNLNDLKRKAFFWVEKLQISRKERIAFGLLLGILVVLFSISLFLQRSFQYDEEEYEQIVAEFEKRSAMIEQQEAERAASYIPGTEDNNANTAASEPGGQTQTPDTEPEPDSSEPITEFPINVNTAGSAELQMLDGIGPAYAQNIIDYREANGGFDSIEELINVKGIGEKRLENIRPYIKIEN